MAPHPVRFHVVRPTRLKRVHVAIRLVLLMALGAVGFSSLYWLLYVALPAVAAWVIVERGRERYLGEEAPKIAHLLRWVAGLYAYLWLLTDSVPELEREGSVELEVSPCGSPTASSALLRILYSIPAVVVLAMLSFVAGMLWVVSAVFVLAQESVPEALADFLELTVRYQIRLFCYHLSLVDRYPTIEPSGGGAVAPPTPI